MKCGYCGYQFEEGDGIRRCSLCPMAKACQRVCCPRCGYETLPEPKWIGRMAGLIKSWRKR